MGRFGMTNIRFNYHLFTFLFVLIVTGLFSSNGVIAQEPKSTLSGRVINKQGQPIEDVTVQLSTSSSITDSEGRFTLTNIHSRQVQLSILERGVRIQAIKIGKVTYYIHSSSRDPFTFTITPGSIINNIEVITAERLKSRGRIVFKNGEPLTETSLTIEFDSITLDRLENYKYRQTIKTDREGFFIHSVYSPFIFTLSVHYRGLSAENGPFLINNVSEPKTSVLKLNGNPDELTEPPPKHENKQPDRIITVTDIPAMWIINPANGHRYKRINCTDRIDAKVQADKENAYLVTIMSDKEQLWLEAAFGKGPYWIGITDIEIEGKWLWENGEAVTYTNWEKYKNDDLQLITTPLDLLRFFGIQDDRKQHEDERKDYAIMSYSNSENEIGKWRKVNSNGDGQRERVQMAIIEKDNFQVKKTETVE